MRDAYAGLVLGSLMGVPVCTPSKLFTTVSQVRLFALLSVAIRGLADI